MITIYPFVNLKYKRCKLGEHLKVLIKFDIYNLLHIKGGVLLRIFETS